MRELLTSRSRILGLETSGTELTHLLKAWLAVSLAFSVAYSGMLPFALLFGLNMLTVGLAFLAHELSHKVVAQHYGCFAEFRANDSMLLLAVLTSFLGVIFAAPGAVMVLGRVKSEQGGRISAAGPAANIVLALLFLSILFYNPSGILGLIAQAGYKINSMLAIFNLIPLGTFDGAKILRWSKTAYFAMIGISLVLILSV